MKTFFIVIALAVALYVFYTIYENGVANAASNQAAADAANQPATDDSLENWLTVPGAVIGSASSIISSLTNLFSGGGVSAAPASGFNISSGGMSLDAITAADNSSPGSWLTGGTLGGDSGTVSDTANSIPLYAVPAVNAATLSPNLDIF